MTPIHDRGLAFDMRTLLDRRRALLLFGGAALAACSAPTSPSGSTTTTTTTAAAADGECAVIPEETAGPYPGDGTNGPNALTESGIVRKDIRSSFGSASGTADGIPLAIELTITDSSKDCAPLAGAAVYVWHCDAAGNYSMYTGAAAQENYLRGVQVTNKAGKVTFTSIFPGAYSGRWPHVHFEVYASLDEATRAGDPIATSQLAFPEDVCAQAYADDRYPNSAGNLEQTSLESDMVFSDDGAAHQLATVTGNASAGYRARLSLAV